MSTGTERDGQPRNEGGPDRPEGTASGMKKAMNLVLEESDLVELIRILMDDDAEAALAFLKQHFKGKARDLLEGG